MLGLGLAWAISLILKHFMPAAMSLPVALLGILVSLLTGLVAGFLPAYRAARMNPVDALRSE